MVSLALIVVSGFIFASMGFVSARFMGSLVICLIPFLKIAKYRHYIALVILFFGAGTFYLVRDVDGHSEAMNHRASELRGNHVSVVGTIENNPVVLKSGNIVFSLSCERLFTKNQWRDVLGGIDVYLVPKDQPLLTRGCRVKVSGRLNVGYYPSKNRLRLYGTSLERESCRFFYDHVEKVRLVGARRLELGVNSYSDELAVYKALVLGYRQHIPRSIIDRFRRTGGAHIFAISGLHVGIVGLLLAFFFKWMGVPRYRLWFVLVPLLAIYVCGTGLKSSAVRAFIMSSVFLVAPALQRKPDIPSSIAIAALLILFVRPFEILSVGFLFSFSVVISIVMVYSRIPDSWLTGNKVKVYGASLFITSFAASLVSLPLSMLYFGVFSPIALIGNLWVVPFTFAIVLCGWIAMLCPFLTVLLNKLAIVLCKCLLGGVAWLDQIPGSSFEVEPPRAPALLFWFGGLLYLALIARNRRTYAYGICSLLLGVLFFVIA